MTGKINAKIIISTKENRDNELNNKIKDVLKAFEITDIKSNISKVNQTHIIQCNFQTKEADIKKFVEILKEILKIHGILGIRTSLNFKDYGYNISKEIVVYSKNDEIIKNIDLSHVKFDYLEEWNNKLIIAFDTKTKIKENPTGKYVHINVPIRYLKTGKVENLGLKVYFKDEEKVDYLILGKLYESFLGVIINDDEDLVMCLEKLDRILFSRGTLLNEEHETIIKRIKEEKQEIGND